MIPWQNCVCSSHVLPSDMMLNVGVNVNVLRNFNIDARDSELSAGAK